MLSTQDRVDGSAAEVSYWIIQKATHVSSTISSVVQKDQARVDIATIIMRFQIIYDSYYHTVSNAEIICAQSPV